MNLKARHLRGRITLDYWRAVMVAVLGWLVI